MTTLLVNQASSLLSYRDIVAEAFSCANSTAAPIQCHLFIGGLETSATHFLTGGIGVLGSLNGFLGGVQWGLSVGVN